MSKTYEQRLRDLGKSVGMHYWAVEVTTELFIETHLELFGKQEEEVLTTIEEEFPHPHLGRTLYKYIPKHVAYNLAERKLTMFHDVTIYPEGTTHVYINELYVDENYLYYRDLPTAVRIHDDVWYLFKTVFGVDQWVPLEPGDRVDVMSVEDLAAFDNQTNLKQPTYVIDEVIKSLGAGSLLRNLLTVYQYPLSDLFEQRLDYVKLMQYFACNRVFPVYAIDEEDYYKSVKDQQEFNDRNEALNDTFSQLISSYDFQLAYNQAIGVCSVE